MTDKTLRELVAVTSFLDTDIFLVQTDPSGTPADNKITGADLLANSLRRLNYQISRTVASNNLTVALKDSDGNDATSTKPLNFNINGTIRQVTGALSVTVNAGTGTFNLGSSELKALDQDMFVYVGWRVASSTVFILISRIPYARVYSEFSATTTNEKYGAYSGSAPASTDEVVNIGRFNAQNSGSSSYNWSIPATSVIINRPIFETRWLTYTPTISSTTGTITTPGATAGNYKIFGSSATVNHSGAITTNGTGATGVRITLPFTPSTDYSVYSGRENSVTGNMLQARVASNTLEYFTYSNTYPGGDGRSVIGGGGILRI